MGTNCVGHVHPALRASIHAVTEQAREKLFLSEGAGARRALGDSVIPAVLEEGHALFAGEAARLEAVDVDHSIAVALDGVLGREHPGAPGTRGFWSHLSWRTE
jgi:hypothetical protein